VTSLLLHMTTRAMYAEAQRTGRYRVASLAAEGFIHLSTAEQVHLPANALFRGRRDIVLLCIDPDRLGAAVLWEPVDSADPQSMRFPHLYGELDIAAVVAVVDYLPAADGSFAPPVIQDLPGQPGGTM